jgi:hypothetical protein
MPIFEYHIHNHVDLEEVTKKIDHLIKNQKIIMAAIDTLKEKLAVSDEKITILTTATQGVAADVAFIKAKLEANEGGIDAAGVAELTALVDAQSSKLTEAATALADLDASTDSTGGGTPTP